MYIKRHCCVANNVKNMLYYGRQNIEDRKYGINEIS